MKIVGTGIMLVLFAALLMLIGCAATKVAKCTDSADTPQVHYVAGMNALEAGNMSLAQEKLERSLYCNAEFSPAQGGLAVVNSEKTRSQPDPAFKDVEAKRAYENLKIARKMADSENDYVEHDLAAIRVGTVLKDKGWLDAVEDAFNDGSKRKVDESKLLYYHGIEALNYFRGVAYLEALEFQKARDDFAAVLNAKRDGKWHEPADKNWKKADRIVRAMAGQTAGDIGRKIAIKETVNRADVAALLVDEMKIEKLLAGRIPDNSKNADLKAEFVPADMVNHQFRNEVLTLMKWKVRGIEPKYDEVTKASLFMPEDSFTRGELALVLEDVLAKLIGNDKLASAYFSQENSPFTDVRNSSPIFNAVITVTTRGIMEGDVYGEFRPNNPVSGADALLAIRMLQQKMNIH